MIKLTGGIGSFTISWDPLHIPDIAGYVVCGVPGVEDFAVSGSNILNVGPETSYTYYTTTSGMFSAKVAAYDSFSNPKALILSDLNFSTLQTVEVLGLLSETLDALTGQLTESQLHQDLSGRIDLIDLPTLGLVDRLDQEILDRGLAVTQEAQDRATALTSYYTKVEADSATASAITGATSSLVSNSSLATSLSSYYTKTAADEATASAITGATSSLVSNSSLATSLTSYYTKTEADSATATAITGATSSLVSNSSLATSLSSYYTKVEADSATATAITGATSSLVSNSSLATSLSSYYTKTEADSATASAITGATSEFVTNNSLASSLTSYYTKTAADSAVATYVDQTSTTIQGLVASASIESTVRASTTGPDWDSGTVYTKGKVVVFKVGSTPYLFQRITATGGTPSPSVVDGVAQTTTDWKPVAANLYAETMLKTDVNGHVVGVGIANDGVTGEVEILADKFKIVHPTLPATSAQVFTVGTVNGVTGQVGIRGELLIDGSLIVSQNVSVGGTLSIGGATVSFAAPTPVGIGAIETSLGNAPAGILNSNVTATSINAVATNLSNAPAGILNSNVTPTSINAVATSLSNAPAGILNSNVTATSIGAVKTDLTNAPSGILNSNITLSGLGYTVPTYDLIGGTKPPTDADKTSSILGTTGTLTLNAALTINSLLTISGSAAGITSGLASYNADGSGFWVSKDVSNSRLRVGTVSAGVLTNGFVWDGTAFKVKGEIQATSGTFSGNITSSATITGGTLQTSGSGDRIVISGADNKLSFFGNRGDGTTDDVITVGAPFTDGGRTTYARFGKNTTGYSRVGITALSYSGAGIVASSVTDGAALLQGGTTLGGYGASLSGYIPLKLMPGASTTDPSDYGAGNFYVRSDGVLRYHDGSSWKTVQLV